jgi:hypothetical protein
MPLIAIQLQPITHHRDIHPDTNAHISHKYCQRVEKARENMHQSNGVQLYIRNNGDHDCIVRISAKAEEVDEIVTKNFEAIAK